MSVSPQPKFGGFSSASELPLLWQKYLRCVVVCRQPGRIEFAYCLEERVVFCYGQTFVTVFINTLGRI